MAASHAFEQITAQAGEAQHPLYPVIRSKIKILASATIGLERAIGIAAARSFANLAARELYSRLGLKELGLRKVFEKLNEETVFRTDTYTIGGSLVRNESDGKALYLIMRECPVRQILYQEDLPAGRTLCNMFCLLVSRIFSEKLGGRYEAKLVRYGPQACLVRVAIKSGPEPPSDFRLKSRKPGFEEYIEKLDMMLTEMLHVFDRVLYRVLGGNPAMSYRTGKIYGRFDGLHLLTEVGSIMSLEEAVEIINRNMGDVVTLRVGDGKLGVEKSLMLDMVSDLEHGAFVARMLQGYLAGMLSTLTGRNVDLKIINISDPRTLEIYMR